MRSQSTRINVDCVRQGSMRRGEIPTRKSDIFIFILHRSLDTAMRVTSLPVVVCLTVNSFYSNRNPRILLGFGIEYQYGHVIIEALSAFRVLFPSDHTSLENKKRS